MTDEELEVKITALSSEDVEGGLLKRAEMGGYDASAASDIFTLVSGENHIEVTFAGKFAGRMVKHDRLIPDEISFEIMEQQ